MDTNLSDKVVVITGGATGIGFGIADKYLEKGAKTVILLDINETQGDKAVRTLVSKYGNKRAVFIKCDVITDLDAVSKHIIDTYKTVDVLVNNAGISDELAIKKTVDINATAVIQWSMKFWEHMRTEKGGKGGTIINIASIYGYKTDPYLPVYHASKFAVMGFTRSLGHKYNFERTRVRVVVLCPGFTETSLAVEAKTWDSEQLQQDFLVFMKSQEWQPVDAVGKAAVDVFEKADSGTAWATEGSKPVVQVP